MFEATAILQLVLLLVWKCLRITPINQQHPMFADIFTGLLVLENVANSVSLSFAPGLLEVLQPPTLPLSTSSKAFRITFPKSRPYTLSHWRNRDSDPSDTSALALSVYTVSFLV